MKDKIKNRLFRGWIAFVAAALLAAGTVLAVDHYASGNQEAKVVPVKLEVDNAPLNREAGLKSSYASVVENVRPSVVNIYTTTEVQVDPRRQLPFEEFPFLRRFFDNPYGGEGRSFGNRERPAPKRHGLGSGVIVTQDGYILTNNHLVERADEIKVALSDGREFEAKVVGADPKTDIAVVKIGAQDLPYLVSADSDQVRVGDVVLAIGNPFNVGQTVTMGIVSATGRYGSTGLDYEDFIQTDAAINPGNSGGALVDAEGRLIGISTAILSRSGGNNGIGFAIPTNLARDVMESLIEHGEVIRGFLGVLIQDVTPELGRAFDLEKNNGALVAEVQPNTPADKGGLQNGDVIVEFSGKTVKDSRNLKLQVAETQPGKEVPVKIIREGNEKDLRIHLGKLDEDRLASQAGESSESSNDLLDGVIVDDLDRATRAQLNTPENLKGALVVRIDPASPAYEAGLRQGDVIQEIDRTPVESAEDAVTLSENIEDDSVLLRVWSRGGSRYLVVRDSEQQG